MPIYEYQCKKCSHRFERIQQFSDAPVKTCPKCGGKVEKLISTSSVQFKGSGWYVSDYGRKGSGGGDSKKEGSEAKKESGEAKKEGGEQKKESADTAKTAEKKESKSSSKGEKS